MGGVVPSTAGAAPNPRLAPIVRGSSGGRQGASSSSSASGDKKDGSKGMPISEDASLDQLVRAARKSSTASGGGASRGSRGSSGGRARGKGSKRAAALGMDDSDSDGSDLRMPGEGGAGAGAAEMEGSEEEAAAPKEQLPPWPPEFDPSGTDTHVPLSLPFYPGRDALERARVQGLAPIGSAGASAGSGSGGGAAGRADSGPPPGSRPGAAFGRTVSASSGFSGSSIPGGGSATGGAAQLAPPGMRARSSSVSSVTSVASHRVESLKSEAARLAIQGSVPAATAFSAAASAAARSAGAAPSLPAPTHLADRLRVAAGLARRTGKTLHRAETAALLSRRGSASAAASARRPGSATDGTPGPEHLDRKVSDPSTFPLDEVPLFLMQLPTRLPMRSPDSSGTGAGAGAQGQGQEASGGRAET